MHTAEASAPGGRAPRDPRIYQITVLCVLLIYGLLGLDLEVRLPMAVTVLVTAQLTQWACTRWRGLPAFDPNSALISGLSLCLLLRTESLALAAAGAIIAIASKFIIRLRGKHVFNPTNFALVVLLVLSDRVWVSPGQWGSLAYLALLIACFGMIVINRSRRSDVTLAFLGFYCALLFGRALWLGDPPAIPLHQVQSGALLIFAFFMISDPRTTPDSRAGRILFAALVTLIAGYLRFALYEPNGVLYALVIACLLVPLIDRLLPGERFEWRAPTTGERPGRSAAQPAALLRNH